jgi:hypothetical protein
MVKMVQNKHYSLSALNGVHSTFPLLNSFNGDANMKMGH